MSHQLRVRDRRRVVRELLEHLLEQLETMDEDELAQLSDRYDLDELGVDQDDLVEEDLWP